MHWKMLVLGVGVGLGLGGAVSVTATATEPVQQSCAIFRAGQDVYLKEAEGGWKPSSKRSPPETQLPPGYVANGVSLTSSGTFYISACRAR